MHSKHCLTRTWVRVSGVGVNLSVGHLIAKNIGYADIYVEMQIPYIGRNKMKVEKSIMLNKCKLGDLNPRPPINQTLIPR